MEPAKKLIVEVVDAKNLSPKDGQGTSSPYVVIDYYGQRRRTKTAVRDLNPTWNETLEFTVKKRPSDVFVDVLELDVYHDKNFGHTRRNHFLGRIRMGSGQFVKKGEEALIYYPLEKKSLFSLVQGEIGLRVYYVDEVVPPPSPPPLPAVEEVKTEEVKVDEPSPSVEEVKVDEPSPVVEEVKVVEQPPEVNTELPPPTETTAPKIETQSAEEEKKDTNQPPLADVAPGNVVIQGEKPIGSDPGPNMETNQNKVDPTEEPTTPLDLPPSLGMPRSVSGSMTDMKVNQINGPQPIRRTASEAASYTTDLSETSTIERSTFDLVEKMHYVFVRVVKAKSLPTNGNPVVRISISNNHMRSKPARETACFEWDQTFAFLRESPDSSSILEITIWDPPLNFQDSDVASTNFLGGLCFDVTEIPLRDPPDSPLAPQWYRVDGGTAPFGDLMLATWIGTQADESFPDAWKTDAASEASSRAKIYVSPKLWYLRATVIEAQDVSVQPLFTTIKETETSFQIKAQLGFQVLKTKPAVARGGAPSWNEDLLFVAAEPFTDQLVLTLEDRTPKAPISIGVAYVALAGIERRVDDRNVVSRWFSFSDLNDENKRYKGRVHVRLCFDGGYHVRDELAHVCSDYRPTARQLWKPAVGTVELGIIGCKNLLPVKTVNGKGSTDAYTVAKYGPKWVRTRTVIDSLEPRWNEQYTWKVYDPCTVLTVGVFDSSGVFEINGDNNDNPSDFRVGKVRIRISTLETGKVYKNAYPLLLLSNNGVKNMGELELAVRFVRQAPRLDFLHVYTQPLLPLMHHIKPLGIVHQEKLRTTAIKIVTTHFSRSEPPIRPEVVKYMLDADSESFSMRKVRVNWFRIINVLSGLIEMVRWVDDTRLWKNPTTTMLVHALLVMLVWFPDLIVPTLALYMFVVGAWNRRFRPRDLLPHFDPKLSLVDIADSEELDEEFDNVQSTRLPDTVRCRYDKLRMLGTRVQKLLGDFATQGERLQSLVTWQDPHASGIFVGLCLVVALILYMIPSKMVAMAFGFYYFRHPIFRDRMPAPVLNFVRRLPSLSDRIM